VENLLHSQTAIQLYITEEGLKFYKSYMDNLNTSWTLDSFPGCRRNGLGTNTCPPAKSCHEMEPTITKFGNFWLRWI